MVHNPGPSLPQFEPYLLFCQFSSLVFVHPQHNALKSIKIREKSIRQRVSPLRQGNCRVPSLLMHSHRIKLPLSQHDHFISLRDCVHSKKATLVARRSLPHKHFRC